uniref:Putative ovule protein n=1 Tax=Solanum chacoense TaxID=4108 RepID=A0A0V0HPE0_SOLCH
MLHLLFKCLPIVWKNLTSESTGITKRGEYSSKQLLGPKVSSYVPGLLCTHFFSFFITSPGIVMISDSIER